MSARSAKTRLQFGQPVHLAHAAWCLAIPFAAGLALVAGVAPASVAIGAGACLAPPLLGLALVGALRREWAQVALVSAWTGLALAAALVLGAASAAACWFLAPAVIAFTLGRRSLILETGVMSLLAMGLAAALETGGLAPPLYPAAQHPLLAAAAVAMAVILMSAAALAMRRQQALARRAVRRREENSGRFGDAMPGAALMLDSDGRVLWSAGGVERILGVARDALSGARLPSLGRDDADASALQSALEQARGGVSESGVILAVGDDRFAEIRLAGGRDGFTALAVDVTEHQREALELGEARDSALAASEAKSRFLASMSHEIRTPLNAIIGFSDVMKQRLFGPLPAKYAEYADLIHESGCHLLDLVGDVLDMSKIEADRYELKLEEMDARDIATAAAKLVRLRADEAGVQLEVDCGLGPLPVRADRKALRQILLNLLSNAIKFTPKGGEARLTLKSDGGDLALEVSDTGAGMSADEVARIGKPYQQAGSAGATQERGTGLGLSLVAALARLHGGALEIASELGVGTTATVRLPVLIASPAPVTRLDARARLQRARTAGQEILKAKAEAQG